MLFVVFYFIVFSYFLGTFFYVYRARLLFFNEVCFILSMMYCLLSILGMFLQSKNMMK